jgi:hypothetical protein
VASNSTLTPMTMPKPKKRKGKAPVKEVAMKDEAYSRNFGKDGKPKLNATVGGTGEGAMGQRR